MLIRIVRMHFNEAMINDFIEIFNHNKKVIRHFPGCTHLQLLKDPNDPLCYTTLSHWNSPQDLENYRTSELFGEVWKSVKPLFYKKSEAFSLEQLTEPGTDTDLLEHINKHR